jgi:hypothetical protein
MDEVHAKLDEAALYIERNPKLVKSQGNRVNGPEAIGSVARPAQNAWHESRRLCRHLKFRAMRVRNSRWSEELLDRIQHSFPHPIPLQI